MFNVRVIWNGPEVRMVQLLKGEDVVRQNVRFDGLIHEPCEPRCEGMSSLCCHLSETWMTGLLEWQATMVFKSLSKLITCEVCDHPTDGCVCGLDRQEYLDLVLTCDTCPDKTCGYRNDPYNTNGDCLAMK